MAMKSKMELRVALASIGCQWHFRTIAINLKKQLDAELAKIRKEEPYCQDMTDDEIIAHFAEQNR